MASSAGSSKVDLAALTSVFSHLFPPRCLQSAFEDLSRAPGEKKVTFDVTESDLSSSVGPPVQRGDPAVPHSPPPPQ